MSFQNKLLLSFIVTISAVLMFITLTLTSIATQRSLEDAKNQLSLLTNQVLINYRQSMLTTEQQIFNVYNSLDVPELMQQMQADGNRGSQAKKNLSYVLNQMVSVEYPFDFVLVRTLDGQEIHTGGKIANGAHLSEQAARLLDEYQSHSVKWIRSDDGNIYLMRNVYTLSPLTHVGQMIVRVSENDLFHIGKETEQLDYSLALFDGDNNHIVTSGSIESDIQEQLLESMQDTGLTDGVWTWLGTEYYVVVKHSESWSLAGLQPMNRLNNIRDTVFTTSLLFAIAGLVVGVVLIVLLTKRLSRQLEALTNSMDLVSAGNMTQEVPIYSKDDIGQLAVNFNNMTQEIANLMQRILEEEKEKNEAEYRLLEYRYRSLQTQISPHFIYNALETVNAMAKLEENHEISRVVQLMSRYFRNNTKNMMRQYIFLHQEFDNLSAYAEIHQFIHGERLTVRFEFDKRAKEALLPTMILQPVLENALEYGMRLSKEKSSIRVSAQVKGSSLVISVIDDGPGMTEEVRKHLFTLKAQRRDERAGIGLNNVAERLKIIYGQSSSITVESDKNGTCVEITIPLNYMTNG
jgi:sensor histidine kinase YesM